MSREVYLIRYPSHPFKDHWGLWIPSTTNEHIGTIIHVEGDVRNGFTHGIKRSHDLREDSRTKRFDLLGRVPAIHVHETASDDGTEETFDTDPRDDIERIALSIPAPGPSMNSATSKRPPGQRVTLIDCQSWITMVVAKLVVEHIFNESANMTVQNTPGSN